MDTAVYITLYKWFIYYIGYKLMFLLLFLCYKFVNNFFAIVMAKWWYKF